MKSNSDFQKIIKIFENKDDFLITSHQDPDGDSIGSLIGLGKFLESLGKRVVIYNQGRMPQKYKFLDPDNMILFTDEPLKFKPAVVIILECPDLDRIGFVGKFLEDDMTVINIDHHPKNTGYGDINYIDESSCAVAEILYDIIKSNGHAITPETAEAFYAAIASDTGRFKFANTNSRCFKAVSDLVEAGANPKDISDKIFSSFSAGTIKLLGHLLQTLELYDNGRICVLKLRLADLEKYQVLVEDTEGIIDYSLVIAGVKVGALFKERDANTVKVGLRSQNAIDIGIFARRKGGGGHANASGFTVNLPFDEAVKSVVEEVAAYLND